MHIPPYYRKPSWQRFFFGVFVGSVISYLVFIYMHGHIVESLLAENKELSTQMSELKENYDSLVKDKKESDKELENSVTVESIEIEITNSDDLHMDRLLVHDLEGLIKEEINHIIGEDINILARNDRLLKSTIQNKDFTIDDFTYNFIVKTLTISRTVKIDLEAEVSS